MKEAVEMDLALAQLREFWPRLTNNARQFLIRIARPKAPPSKGGLLRK